MTVQRYALRPDIPDHAKAELGTFHPMLQRLLYARGVETRKDAERFLRPDYDFDLFDPFLLTGMEEAVARILKALEAKEKIVIYSDYDADGIPGGVMLRDFFGKIGHESVNNYIPHRHDEGYGFHKDAVEMFHDEGVHLIITIDCGITDTETVARARELGIDVIITDHHEPAQELPPATAIVNPKQSLCTYPEKILCGTGVAFKLIQAILQRNRFGLRDGHEKWFLDLVGIATLSDMVPLVGENRALAYYGLKVLQKSPRPGLQKIWSSLRVDQRTLSEDDIGFSLAPRINAASRMGRPQEAFDLLRAENDTEAGVRSEALNRLNDERKGAVAALVKDIKKHVRERQALGELPSVLVLGDPDWKPSLLGLAANSVVEEVSRPVFLWGRNGDSILKGSCRSDGVTDLTALMERARAAFLQFGGHKMAGGFSVSHEQIHTLESVLNACFEGLIVNGDEVACLVDGTLSPEEVNWDVYRHVEQLAPFGVGNPKPLFMISQARVAEVKQFGKEKNHLEVSIERGGKPLKAISFFSHPDRYATVPEAGKNISLIGTLEKSTFRSYPELRVRIVDII